MAIQYQVTIRDICRTALRRAGQPAPSDAQVTDAIGNQFQEVKNDIKAKAGTHKLLLTSEVTVTAVGVRSYTQPSTVHEVKAIDVFDGPDAWRGTAQTGASASITLASTVGEDEASLQGKQVFTLSGTGSLQWKYITAWNNSTKVATVHSAWTTTPDSTTTYLVANYKRQVLNRSNDELRYDQYQFGHTTDPRLAALEGETLWLAQPPDKIYPLIWTYYKDIDQIDEDDSLFEKMLREWRSVFIEGVTAKSMVLHDDTRQYDHYGGVYGNMLKELARETLTITQTVPYD